MNDISFFFFIITMQKYEKLMKNTCFIQEKTLKNDIY